MNSNSIITSRLQRAVAAKFGDHGAASDLAREIGVSVQTTSKWLRGLTSPSEKRWPSIAQALGVSVQWLTGATADQPEDAPPRINSESMNHLCEAVDIVLPLANKLRPDISSEEMKKLLIQATELLGAGRDRVHVQGVIANQLL